MAERWNRSTALHRPGRTLGQMRVLVPALAALAACASEPFSYLEADRWSRVEMNTSDTLIVSIDGKPNLSGSRIRVDPGHRRIVFQMKPGDGSPSIRQKTLELDVEPCTHYWFEAKRASAQDLDFEPRVNHKDPIVGCGPASGSGSQM
jgi:hypothetical protein